MQQVLLQQDTRVVIDVRICEVHTEDAVVVGEVRPQEEGLKSIDEQLEMREVAGVAIEQAVRPAGRSTDVAVLSNTRKQSSRFMVRRSRVVGSVAGI
jgi:hypothetical protein